MKRIQLTQERALFVGYLLLVAWLPIPLGSNREWSWSLFEFGAFFLLLWAFLLIFERRLGRRAFPHNAFVIFALILSSLAFQLFQITPMPDAVLSLLAPNYANVVGSGVYEGIDSISIDKGRGIENVLKLAAYFSMFLTTFLVIRTRSRVKKLFIVLAVVGVLQAVYGLSQVFTQLSLGEGLADVDQIRGTFVNKNSFGGYLNFVIAVVFGLFMFELQKLPKNHLKMNYLGGQTITVAIYFLILVMTLGLTQSRGAGAAFLATALFIGALLLVNRGSRRWVGKNLLVGSFMTIAVITLIGSQVLSERWLSLPVDMLNRTEMWLLTLNLFKDFSILGVGGGNFNVVLPLYESHSLGVYINHAHNDYLELLAEQGVIGFMLIGALVVYCLVKAVKRVVSLPDKELQVVNAVGLFGVCTMLLHAFVDFNFQIPSNAAYFYIFLALSVVKLRRDPGKVRKTVSALQPNQVIEETANVV